MVFCQFSRHNTYLSIPGKLSEVHLHAWLFSNPCGKVLITVGISWSPDLRVQHKPNWQTQNFLSIFRVFLPFTPNSEQSTKFGAHSQLCCKVFDNEVEHNAVMNSCVEQLCCTCCPAKCPDLLLDGGPDVECPDDGPHALGLLHGGQTSHAAAYHQHLGRRHLACGGGRKYNLR